MIFVEDDAKNEYVLYKVYKWKAHTTHTTFKTVVLD